MSNARTNKLVAIWRILTCRNFILIDVNEIRVADRKGRSLRVLIRTNHTLLSDYLTIKGALIMTHEELTKEQSHE